MHVVLANYRLEAEATSPSEAYLLTVGQELQRLGHDVTLHAEHCPDASELAAAHGLRVTGSRDELPDACDAIIAQDGVMSYGLAERYPTVAQLFVQHSELRHVQLPPPLRGLVCAVIVLSERERQRAQAAATQAPVVRLHQPIDTERLTPRGAIRSHPRRALLLRGQRRDALVDAWEKAGVHCVQLSREDARPSELGLAMAEADIVVGEGRAALEGMAFGRAVYVHDEAGGGRWVTAERYPQLEADEFARPSAPGAPDDKRLRDDLRDYSPDMGAINRDLVVAHHDARGHADDLVRAIDEHARPREPIAAPWQELARLVRAQWLADSHRQSLLEEVQQLRGRTVDAERHVHDLEARAQSLEARAQSAERALAQASWLLGTRRAQAGLRMGRVLDTMRASRGRRTPPP